MANRNIKIAATTIVLVLAFTGLLWSTLQEGTEYFKNVDEVLKDQQAWQNKPLQLHGYVVPGSIYRKRDSLEYKFQVQNSPPRAQQSSPPSIVEATYTGIVPDTFKDEAEVVLKGTLTADGFRTAPNGVVAKCPSKYEAASKTTVTSPPGS
jgi:cytochrome c-type biogenesis protein CcmE